jgi:MFS family permease
MLRWIGGAVVGYIGMALVVFAGLSAAYTLMGADRAFRPGSYEVSAVWVVTSIVVGLAAALLGGWLARKVGRDVRAPWILAGLVVVLGLAMALPVVFADQVAAGARTGTVGVMDAMGQARTPTWLLLFNPVLGALGVLLGGRALGAGRDADARARIPG